MEFCSTCSIASTTFCADPEPKRRHLPTPCSSSCPRKGELVTTDVNIVKACADQKPYQHRAVLLIVLGHVLKHLSATGLVAQARRDIGVRLALEDRVPTCGACGDVLCGDL